METDDIIAECIERKKLNPTFTAKQILDSVMDEIAGYKTAMKTRPEFAGPPV